MLESQYMIENVLRTGWFTQAAMPLYWFGGALVAILILWLMLYLVDQLNWSENHRVERPRVCLLSFAKHTL